MVDIVMKINLSQDSSVTSSDEARDLREAPSENMKYSAETPVIGITREKMPLTVGSETAVSQSTAVDNNTVAPLPPQTIVKPQYPTCKNECKVTKSFPWIVEINRRCRAEIGNFNIQILEKLMTTYLRVLPASVTACYQKPNRANKLKISMNDTLMWFHLFYSDIKKPLESSAYLDKMSDLMAMYIDIEITASRRGKESMSKIASKLMSSLYIYLDHSQDHILDTLFKTKCMNKNNSELCNMIFSRVLRDSPGSAVYEMTYVRHVLAFKMWKRLFDGAEERRNVVQLATTRLIPPSQFREKVRAGLLRGVLPKISKSRRDITKFLMQAKFCIKEKTKAFLKAVSDPKQQGVLSTLVPDFDASLFCDLPEGSPPSSNLSLADDTEEPAQSSFMDSGLWSMESSANLKKKPLKAKVNKKAKCKGIATPVFKKDTSAETKADKDLKRKKPEEKPKKQADINPVKPLPAVSQSCDDISSKENCLGTPQVSQSCIPAPIKAEPAESDCIEVKKEIEQVNLVDSPTGGADEGVTASKEEPLTKRLKAERAEDANPIGLLRSGKQLDGRPSNRQWIKQLAESLEKQGRYSKSQEDDLYRLADTKTWMSGGSETVLGVKFTGLFEDTIKPEPLEDLWPETLAADDRIVKNKLRRGERPQRDAVRKSLRLRGNKYKEQVNQVDSHSDQQEIIDSVVERLQKQSRYPSQSSKSSRSPNSESTSHDGSDMVEVNFVMPLVPLSTEPIKEETCSPEPSTNADEIQDDLDRLADTKSWISYGNESSLSLNFPDFSTNLFEDIKAP